ncbi:MAG: hypothetical protein M0Z83_02335 [Betaproteobacteria bacterium]|nr:hypothetical protein [Betaproteobacteria bacterium]
MKTLQIQSKTDLLAAREYFFNCIIDALQTEPMKAEELTGWDMDHVPPRWLLMDVEFGSLLIKVAPNFIGEGDESHYYYSISVAGDILRIGIFMPISKILSAPVKDNGSKRLSQIWNGAPLDVQARGDGIMYEWTFTHFDPSNWGCAEKYILGMRLLHQRYIRLIYNVVREELTPVLC